MARSLGSRGAALLRPALLAALGALAWLVWLAGVSQASDLLPTVPTVPAPTVSLAPVPLPAPVGPLVYDVASAIPDTLVNQLPSAVVTPVAGIIDSVPPLVDNTISELPPLPELPSVPALPPVAGILPPPVLGLPVGAVPSVPLPAGADAGAPAPPDPTTLLRTNALSPAVQAGPAANTRSPGFTPDRLVFMPAAVPAATEMSPVPGGPPPGKPLPPAAPAGQAGAVPGPQGGSAHGAADLPDQRALAPPIGNGPVPDGRQNPAAEPAFDPGSSPD